MKIRIPAFTLLLLVLACASAFGESDLKKIEKLIITSKKINVLNPSTDPEKGDVIIPNHSVGYAGAGATRTELFEQKMKLTKTLERYVAFITPANKHLNQAA